MSDKFDNSNKMSRETGKRKRKNAFGAEMATQGTAKCKKTDSDHRNGLLKCISCLLERLEDYEVHQVMVFAAGMKTSPTSTTSATLTMTKDGSNFKAAASDEVETGVAAKGEADRTISDVTAKTTTTTTATGTRATTTATTTTTTTIKR